MTASQITAPVRAPTDRPAGGCWCGRPLGPVEPRPGTVNHGPTRVRRCERGHEVTVLPEPQHDFDFRPPTKGALVG